MGQEYIIKLVAEENVFRDAFVQAQKQVASLEAEIKRLNESGTRNVRALVQTVERGTQSIKQGMQPVTAAFSAVNDALSANVVTTNKAASAAGGARTAYMMFGGMVQGVSAQLIAGQNPIRVLAVQIPALAQAFAFLGVSLGTIAGGFVALLPLIITGTFAWRAHAAAAEEAASKNKLLAQTQDLIELNQEHINQALKRGAVSKQDAAYIQDLLKLGSREGLRAAQQEMQKLGVSPAQIEAAEKLQKLRREMQIAAVGGLEAEQMKADDLYQQRLKEIRDLAAKSVQAAKEQASAEAAAKAEHDAKNREISEKVAKLNEVQFLKQLSDELAEFEISNEGRITGKAQQEFEMKVRLYGRLRDMKIISEERYQELWDEGNKKRIKGISDEQAAQKKVADTITDIRGRLATAGLDGPGAELAAINFKYDQEIARVKELNLVLEEEKKLIDEINAARGRESAAVVTKNTKFQISEAEKQQQMERQIAHERMRTTSDMFANMAVAAKSFGKEGFLAYKAFAIASTIMSTASAAMSAYDSASKIPYVGPILGPMAAAAAAAAGAAQIATIASQSYGYMRGGWTGEGPETEVAGQVHRREVVIPAPAVRMLGRGFTEGLSRGVVDLSQLQGRVAMPQPITAQDNAAGRSVRQGLAGSGGTAPNVNVEGHKITQFFYDERPHPKDYLASSEGETQIVNIFRRQKLELGQAT